MAQTVKGEPCQQLAVRVDLPHMYGVRQITDKSRASQRRSPNRLRVGALLTLATATLSVFAASPSLASNGPATTSQASIGSAGARQLTAASGETCVSYSTQVVYRNYGYDHWVHLRSECEEPVLCHITSDSNPSGVDRSIGAGANASVLVFRGSPASEFRATVSCKDQ